MKYLIFLLPLALSACITRSVKTVKLNSEFDAQKYKEQLSPGNSSVSGNAFITQAGGGVVTCAGREVYLLPNTAYSAERFVHLYGSDTKGFISVDSYPNIKFDPDFPDYRGMQLSTKCDSQGNFEFQNIKAGEYFVTTNIIWAVAQYRNSGGFVMEKIRVPEKGTLRVVLSP